MGDWADERAAEWLDQAIPALNDGDLDASLSALLREVYGRAKSETLVRCCICEDVTAPRPDCDCVICHRNRTLAEVRRVVEQTASDVRLACISTSESDVVGALRGALLSRLDKL